MKKYTNTTHELRVVEFEDGDAQFLMRGQSFKTSKPVKKVQAGIKVEELHVQRGISK